MLVFGLMFGLAYGVEAGLMFGLMVGLMFGLQHSAWERFAVARCWLAVRGLLPWRLTGFLAEWRARGGEPAVSFPGEGVPSDGHGSHAASGSASVETAVGVDVSAAVESGATARPGAGCLDVFVSHAAVDREWAEWIGWEPENAGYRVLVLAWDATAGSRRTATVHEGPPASATTPSATRSRREGGIQSLAGIGHSNPAQRGSRASRDPGRA